MNFFYMKFVDDFNELNQWLFSLSFFELALFVVSMCVIIYFFYKAL